MVPEWAAGLADGEVRLLVEPQPDGSRVRVAAADRIGLLADVSGALATAGLTVRAARAAVHGRTAVSTWDVESAEVDPARLRLRLDRVLAGAVDLQGRLGAGGAGGADRARVRLLPDVSGTATVLEVRAGDRAGLVWRLCRALADAEVDVRSAHLETLGPQAEDVVYVTDRAGLALDAARAELVRAAVEDALAAEPRVGDG